MKTFIDRAVKPVSRSKAKDTSSGKQHNQGSFQLVDNRPEAKAQRSLQRLAKNHAQRDVTQRLIAVIGEEVPSGSTTLEEGATTLMERVNEDVYYEEDEILGGGFSAPKADETIYLIAHGDNPAISLTKEAALGEKSGKEVKDIVKKILQKFKSKNGSLQFSGRIILEGCHTAEPVVDGKGKAKKGSLMYDFQQAMLKDKYFKKHMAPEATIGGYMGQAFSNGDYQEGYGTANTEHPLTIRYQRQRGIQGERAEDDSISYDNTESFLESRWRQSLDFGKPDKMKSKKKKKRKKNNVL